jgi:transcriptional regulator with XRE-family HTH domain
LIVNHYFVFIMVIARNGEFGEARVNLKSLRDILASNLKANRRKSKLSQAKLAEKAGISTQYIAMIELSRQFPTPEVLERIAEALGIEAYELFTVQETPEDAMERLQKAIVKEIRQVIVEVLETALADKHKN